jgi:hypothetical protein
MKIYNEVVYQIVDDKLVKVSEDSFDYEGELVLCGSGASSGGGTLNTNIKDAQASLGRRALGDGYEGTKKGWETNLGVHADAGGKALTKGFEGSYGGGDLSKPGSTTKDFTDYVKKLAGKAELYAWGTNSTDAPAEPTTTEEAALESPVEDDSIYDAGDATAIARLKNSRKNPDLMRGRGAANQTQGQSATLITS